MFTCLLDLTAAVDPIPLFLAALALQGSVVLWSVSAARSGLGSPGMAVASAGRGAPGCTGACGRSGSEGREPGSIGEPYGFHTALAAWPCTALIDGVMILTQLEELANTETFAKVAAGGGDNIRRCIPSWCNGAVCSALSECNETFSGGSWGPLERPPPCSTLRRPDAPEERRGKGEKGPKRTEAFKSLAEEVEDPELYFETLEKLKEVGGCEEKSLRGSHAVRGREQRGCGRLLEYFFHELRGCNAATGWSMNDPHPPHLISFC